MRKETCIHYRGSNEEQICSRGIDVRARFQPRWPCWTGNRPPESSAVCAFFEAPTDEQITEDAGKAREGIAKMLIANVAIHEWERTQPKERPLQGTIDCPVCKKALYVVITERCVYAQCETEKCVNFRGSRG